MRAPVGIAYLFPDDAASEAWWHNLQCDLYTTAHQLLHGEDEEGVALYGGEVLTHWGTARVIGVVERLERRLRAGWRPPTRADLEGFLWSRLRFACKAVLCAQRPLKRPPAIVAIDALTGDLPAPASSKIHPEVWLCLTDAISLAPVRQALSGKPELLATMETLFTIVSALEDAGDDCPPGDWPGWRKRVLGRCAGDLGMAQNTLHKRLERIRDLWPKE